MQAFTYSNPASLSEATKLLGSKWGEADVLAGGTDQLSLMKDYLHTPQRVVNIKNIKELGGIGKTAGGLRIGATVTLDELAGHAQVRQLFPSLVTAALGVTSPQIRNMGTVGGDLCQRPRCWYFRQGLGLMSPHVRDGENRYHAIFGNNRAAFVSPSSLAPALIALGAKVKLVSADGNREIPVEQFFVVPSTPEEREIALKPNEILTEIIVPTAAIRNATYEVRQKEALDWPLVAAAVALTMKGSSVGNARIILGHVAPTPWVASQAAQSLAGKSISEAVAEEAGKAAVAGATPLSQNAYKVQLARVAVKRALLAAAGKA